MYWSSLYQHSLLKKGHFTQIPVNRVCLNEFVDAYLSEYYSSQFLLLSSTPCFSESVAVYDSQSLQTLSHI